MTPQASYFIPGLLEDTDKYIEVADGHHVTENKKVQVQIKMCDDNGNFFNRDIAQLTLGTRSMR